MKDKVNIIYEIMFLGRFGRQRSGMARRRSFQPASRRGGRQYLRRGRQEMDAAAAAPAEGEDEEAIDPIACDPKAPQGGFLNFAVRWEQGKF